MIMWIIHIICLLFFLPALLFTIPLHLILNAVEKRNKEDKKMEVTKEKKR